MRHQRRAELGRDVGQGSELLGVRVRAREVDESERQRPRPRFEPSPYLVLHRAELLAARLAPLSAHDQVTDGAVPDRGHERRRRPRLRQRLEVLVERRPRPLGRPATLEAAEIGLPLGPPAGSDRRGRQSVGVDQLGREPLRDLRLQQRVVERAQRRMRVHVDEPRAKHQPGAVDLLRGLQLGERRRNRLDPPLDYSNVGHERRGVAWVHGRVADEQVDAHRRSR